MVAHGERHVSPAPLELVGDLGARRRRTDDEDSPGVELIRIAVVDGGELADGRGELCGEGRDTRCTACAGGDDDGLTAELTLVGADQVAADHCSH